ncbi:DUF1761 family protein [Aliiroseovarius sp. 2305UL8-7]|uniref:DUF1761 family protein n=1 Tax=Aliiroseovarius conchicola TaxID=3121637 RepID=UPI003527D517
MINWVAMGAGVIGAFVLGFVVYGPFLGLQRRWAEGTRISPEPPEKMPMGAMLAQLIALILLALVIAITETTGALGAAMVAILAFAAQAGSVGAWAQKSGFAISVDVGYALLCGVVMIAAQGIL